MDNVQEIIEKVRPQINGELNPSDDGQAIYVQKENVITLLKLLKEKFEYRMFADITSSDFEDRFEVVYHLMKFDGEVIRIKVKLPKSSSKVQTATRLWKAANVQEREIFDLMGIEFEGHDNLKRILLPDEFEGHPLRKKFKLEVVNRF